MKTKEKLTKKEKEMYTIIKTYLIKENNKYKREINWNDFLLGFECGIKYIEKIIKEKKNE